MTEEERCPDHDSVAVFLTIRILELRCWHSLPSRFDGKILLKCMGLLEEDKLNNQK